FLSRSIELSHSCVISGTWVSAKKRALDKPPSTVARSVIANGTAGPRDGPAQPSNAIGNIPADRRSSERRRSTASRWPALTAPLRPGGAVAFPEHLTIVVNRFIASATSRRLSHCSTREASYSTRFAHLTQRYFGVLGFDYVSQPKPPR